MEGTIADVRCLSCGAPAKYDVVRQSYVCAYCGGRVEVSQAQAQKQGFRQLQQEKIRSSADAFRLQRANCTGCGAQLIFEENEAQSSCAFCGRELVRKAYASSKELPEMILPFRLTEEEARDCLREWCRANPRRVEAKHLTALADRLRGFYLPYELVRGPVSSRVSRMDAKRVYSCGGYVDNVFVSASRQLDNRMLDAMEPFELEELMPFEFAYAAGQRIKVRDVDEKELKNRVDTEVSEDYAPVVRAALETQAVEVRTDASDVLRLPVLLPVYYLREGEVTAAVNGQTGKVSVRAEKASHYYFLPWWLKAILATLIIGGAAFGAFRVFGMEPVTGLLIAGMLAFITLIITLCAYSDAVRPKFRVEAERKIFTSAGGPLRRVNGSLVRDAKALTKEVTPPVFFETLDGARRPVRLDFSSFKRKLLVAGLAVAALFLPVIIALFLNGFDFQRLTLGGSAVWFCIMVPVVPIYILKFDVIERYDRPWIYVLGEDGRETRWRPRGEKPRITAKDVLRVLFVPPLSLAIWFGIACFCAMCYLTAFGFGD
jgi:predicted RNA-binding Zn-ribbon protein involved in translation (DUF1610 family)